MSFAAEEVPCPDRAHRARHGKHRRYIKSPNTSMYITKTLHDPANTLSKTQRKKVMDEKIDGFSADVSYSLNKHKRWSCINPSSLLKASEENTPEMIVVKRNDIPSDENAGGSVTNVSVMEDGVIKKLSSGGRRKPLKYFNNQMRELRQIDKKAVEPARILFNITTDASSLQSSKKKPRRTHKRNKNTVKIEDSDYEKIQCWWDKCRESPAYKFHGESRTATLGDYLPVNHESLLKPRRSKSSSCVKYSHSDISNEENKANGTKFIGLQNITDATKAAHIFEIIDLDMKSSYDLEQTITKVPEQYTVTWCGTSRVSVGTPPFSQPKCVVFFEKTRKPDTLRIRISIDRPYLLRYDRTYIIDSITAAAKKDISIIYVQIIDCLKEMRKICKVSENDDNRVSWFPECFMSAVNSTWIAPNAIGFSEQEQLKYLNQFYNECCSSQLDSFQASEDPLKCCCCRMSGLDDLFPSFEGMMCKDCVVSSITRQLRTNHYPIEIPITSGGEMSSIEFLYAILPMPVIRLLIRESVAFLKSLDNPDLWMLDCPCCLSPLMLTERYEFNCCSCPECGCAFCYLCYSEPHWPMTCEQFKRWVEKWDTQYIFDKNYSFAEGVVHMCCQCGGIFHASSLPPRCRKYRCWYSYNDDGTLWHGHGHQYPFPAKIQRHIAAVGEAVTYCEECGTRTGPSTIAAKQIISKSFSSLCTEARNQRFDEHNSRDFKKFVARTLSSQKDRDRVENIRKTILFLTEACTGWLYLVKPSNCTHLQFVISKLFRKFLSVQRRTYITRYEFERDINKLEKETKNLIDLFRQQLNVVE
ncbi:unnamed protein product [Cylicocyclus nassatus]|uniref:Uncharacterized protein n=1 Tax=Cylicocyclus nassatus TaxID=53992 RepID=A0AA36DK93_CYLNA|nr:unnamed protein product [Cylicocyclus nassatus]